MRELKFRAYDKGNEYDEVLEPKMIYDIQTLYDGSISELGGYGSFGHLLDDERFIIMQYTGFKDKNNKEIYEGDIIAQQHSKVKRIIKWNDYAGFDMPANIPSAGNPWEVIGNIFENSELFK